jgi:hypothetical protein
MMDSFNSRPTAPRDELVTLRANVQHLENAEGSDAVAFIEQLLVERIAKLEANQAPGQAPAPRKRPKDRRYNLPRSCRYNPPPG